MRFLTSSSTIDESVDGGVSAALVRTIAAAAALAMAVVDSLLDVEVEVVDSW